MKTLTRSPEGGWVTVAVTRHQPLEGSMVAESIVVFGIETFARSSHGQTGLASGKSGSGGASAAGTRTTAPERMVTRMARVIMSFRCMAECMLIRNGYSGDR